MLHCLFEFSWLLMQTRWFGTEILWTPFLVFMELAVLGVTEHIIVAPAAYAMVGKMWLNLMSCAF
jgi:hypothetical protein